ncbi:centromere protein V [Aspergillus udagawae]|uniref:Centromere protein V n=1 Tax=Aspergillus udagawae TaxID=91492 RepID=A0A8E0R4D2_9EURO|nr:uncharacterized protein Aud_001912 [Aspergillus udagawae]GFF34542.1 centromere protein V [Aspergillus udagawae]GIC94583.1 hypothetical protein Aud_001912 [Aspergillus udagawae]
MSNQKSYTANCHCGNVKLSFSTSPPIEEADVISCNCSICNINGYMLTFVPTSKVTFETDKDAVTEYRFATRNYPHYFCRTCGTSVYVQCTAPGKEDQPTGINVRTIQGLDIKALKIREYDGKNLL